MYIVIEGTCSLGSIQPEETLFRLLFFPLSSNAFSPLLLFFSVTPRKKSDTLCCCCALCVIGRHQYHARTEWLGSIDTRSEYPYFFETSNFNSLLCRWRCQSFNANEKNMPMNSNDFTYEEVSINDNHKPKAKTKS